MAKEARSKSTENAQKTVKPQTTTLTTFVGTAIAQSAWAALPTRLLDSPPAGHFVQDPGSQGHHRELTRSQARSQQPRAYSQLSPARLVCPARKAVTVGPLKRGVGRAE